MLVHGQPWGGQDPVFPSEGSLSYSGSRKAFLQWMLFCRAPQGRFVPLTFNIPAFLCLCQKIRLGFHFIKIIKPEKVELRLGLFAFWKTAIGLFKGPIPGFITQLQGPQEGRVLRPTHSADRERWIFKLSTFALQCECFRAIMLR